MKEIRSEKRRKIKGIQIEKKEMKLLYLQMTSSFIQKIPGDQKENN